MSALFWLSETQWKAIEPHLPTNLVRGGSTIAGSSPASSTSSRSAADGVIVRPSTGGDHRLQSLQSVVAAALREGCGERHVRFLAPLAFLSPKIVQAISDGNVPST